MCISQGYILLLCLALMTMLRSDMVWSMQYAVIYYYMKTIFFSKFMLINCNRFISWELYKKYYWAYFLSFGVGWVSNSLL